MRPKTACALTLLGCVALLSIAKPAAALTVEVARKCKALTDTAYPPREPGNPAAGSTKGGGRAAQAYFEKCVADSTKADDYAAKPTK